MLWEADVHMSAPWSADNNEAYSEELRYYLSNTTRVPPVVPGYRMIILSHIYKLPITLVFHDKWDAWHYIPRSSLKNLISRDICGFMH